MTTRATGTSLLRVLWSLLLIPVLAPLAAAAPEPGADDTMEVRLAVDGARADLKRVRAADLETVAEILKKRLPILTVKEGDVQAASPESIRARFPAELLTELQLRAFARQGHLEIRALDGVKTQLNGRGRYMLDDRTVQDLNGAQTTLRFRDLETDRRLTAAEFLPRCPVLVGPEDLEPGAAQRVGQGLSLAVRVQFTRKAAIRLRRYTAQPGRLLAIVLDGEIVGLHVAARRVRKPGKGQDEELGQLDVVAGFGTEEEAGYLALALNSGPLPLPLKLLGSGPAAPAEPAPPSP